MKDFGLKLNPSCFFFSCKKQNRKSRLELDFLKSPSFWLCDLVARSAASRPKQRPVCGLKYSTLKFMRLTCGKSRLEFAVLR